MSREMNTREAFVLFAEKGNVRSNVEELMRDRPSVEQLNAAIIVMYRRNEDITIAKIQEATNIVTAQHLMDHIDVRSILRGHVRHLERERMLEQNS